ncbi:serine/threonine-protein kinase [Streptomyces sp. 8N706]|uniref:serine/threonine-protein kinase n=1 Tax=Streptomyces sp. 8N706 TaxID=3457416 RepID=UPI003FD5A5B5
MDALRSDDPQRIGAYRLLGRLGAGGMGLVYLARSDRGRTVAVKLIRQELADQEEFRRRFRQEVHAARRVGGEWTAPVLDADTEAPTPWVATGYIAGPSLQSVITEHGPLPERSVRVLAAGLARALQDIHGAGLIHRDLKPSNVLVTIDGPRVIDFGIARALGTVTDGGLTRTGAMVGSPGFMAPEQVRGESITTACDVFCLGSVLAYAASGQLPFGTANSGLHALMYRIAEERPDLTGLPEQLRELAADCLTKDPAQRPTPAQVLERADAEGQPGEPWLPGGLVAQLGRHAVQLLDAENPEAAPPAGPRAQGPHSMPTMVALPAEPPAPGPPTPPYGPPPPATAAYGHPQPGYGYPQPPAGYGTTVGYAPEPERRVRTTALMVAVALVVALAGGTTVYALMQKDDARGSQSRERSATSNDRAGTGGEESPAGGSSGSGGSPSPSDPSGSAAGGIPQEYLGTWESRFGASGTDVRRFTLRQGAPGETVFTMTADGASYHCAFTAELRSAGPPVELEPSTVTSGPAESCKAGPVTALELTGDGNLRRTFSDGSATPLTYSRVG